MLLLGVLIICGLEERHVTKMGRVEVQPTNVAEDLDDFLVPEMAVCIIAFAIDRITVRIQDSSLENTQTRSNL